MEKISYKGWPNCYRLQSRDLELIVPEDIGPRIMSLRYRGGENLLAEYPADLGKRGGSEYRFYGGHRLWHAPEDPIRTYSPDNDPIEVENYGAFIRLTEKVEPRTGIQKEIDIALDPERPTVTLTHRLINRNLWTIPLAPWAITVMGVETTAILPLPIRQKQPENLLPVNSLSMWAYTDLSDPRWTFGSEYILLRQDKKAATPLKIGLSAPKGWIAAVREQVLFVKTFDYSPTASYPDFHSSAETFTNEVMLEVETLSPIRKVAPGECVEHREGWHLFGDVEAPRSEQEVLQSIVPRVQSVPKMK